MKLARGTWASRDEPGKVCIAHYADSGIFLETPDEARRFAASLMKAADEAEAMAAEHTKGE